MNWMNYKLAYTKLTDEQIMSLYAGNAITLQFDKAGQRYKFPTVGPQCDGLQEAVEKLLGREPVAAAE